MILPTIRVRRDGPRGYRLINKADFDPARHELFDPVDMGESRKTTILAIGRGPGGRWCVKRGKERVSDLFDTEAEAEAARAAMEG